MTKKKTIKEKIPWDDLHEIIGLTLLDIHGQIEDLGRGYGWESRLEYEYFEDGTERFYIIHEREETDKEFARREKEEQQHKKRAEENEYKEYLRLKKKFEKKYLELKKKIDEGRQKDKENSGDSK